GSTPHPALQDDQLISEHRILRLKPALRLERRGQHGQNKPNQRDHRASLADSVTPKIRIRFSVHTGPVGSQKCPTRAALLTATAQCATTPSALSACDSFHCIKSTLSSRSSPFPGFFVPIARRGHVGHGSRCSIVTQLKRIVSLRQHPS